MNPRPPTNWVAGREATQSTVLRGRRLFFARAAWVAVAALTLGLFVASVPLAYKRLSTVCEGAGCEYPRLLPEGAKALEGLGLSVGLYAAYNLALALVLALGFWAIGVILFWKNRSGHRLAFYASIALVTFGAIQADTLHWLAEAYPGLDLAVNLVYFVGEASFFVLFCVFPDGRFVPRWTRWAAVVWIIYWLLDSFFPDSPVSPGNWPLVIDALLFLALIGSLVVAQIYRYRRVSGPVERQQTKWVVFGFSATIVVFVVAALIVWIFALTQAGIPQVLYDLVGRTVSLLTALLIPLSIGFAVQRHRLWDIDAIINRALVYGSLTTVLAGVFAITDTLLLPRVVQAILGEDDPSLNAVVSALIIAVLFEPLRRRIKVGVNKLTDWLVGGDKTSEAPR